MRRTILERADRAVYALPLFLPIILGIIVASVTGAVPTSLAEAKAVLAQPFSTIAGTSYADQAADMDASYEESSESESDALKDLGIKTDYAWPGPAGEGGDDDAMQGVDGADHDEMPEAVEEPDNVVIEGGKWAAELHGDVRPTCPDRLDSVTYRNASRRTALATYPRSGNSYIRGLMERSTGYRTSSICARSGSDTALTGQTATTACSPPTRMSATTRPSSSSRPTSRLSASSTTITGLISTAPCISFASASPPWLFLS